MMPKYLSREEVERIFGQWLKQAEAQLIDARIQSHTWSEMVARIERDIADLEAQRDECLSTLPQG